jgi:hypothetical protein
MLHEETVSEGTLALIRRMTQDEMLKDFTLVGGTALALQLGHRKSVDIDLFGSRDFDGGPIARHLESEYNAQIIGAVNNNVFAWVGEVRTSLITHKYPLIAPLVETDGVKMASLDDIAAMKLHAIFTSGQRSKDFADMYYLLDVIGNHNCRIFRNQEYSVFGNKEYIGFGNKGAEKMATRNAEICRINIPGNGVNPLFIKAYGLS